MASCVSPEIYEGVLPSLQSQKLPYGFAINAFIDIPEEINFNNEFSKQPNNLFGLRKDLTPEKYTAFSLDAINKGAKFLKGCCNIMPDHIKYLHKNIS